MEKRVYKDHPAHRADLEIEEKEVSQAKEAVLDYLGHQVHEGKREGKEATVLLAHPVL